ncbi:MAG: hypothetical protein ACPLX8_00405 [Nanopusillaceae archaeon]
MKFKFKYAESDEVTFETEADSIVEAISKLRKLDGKINNPSNLILDVRKWYISNSLRLKSSENVSVKEKISMN